MHDIKAIRENPDAWVRGWSSRGVEDAEVLVAQILKLDADLRAAQTAGQNALAKRNESSKLIGAAKTKKDEAEAQRLMAEVETLKGDIADAEQRESDVGRNLRGILERLPNIPAAEVPFGIDEHSNTEQHRRGTPRDITAPEDHVSLGERLGMMDFEAAARMSGARFVVLKGQLARLERAIGQFMLDLQTSDHGYTEVNPPFLVRDSAMYGTGQLPKFGEDLFYSTSVRRPSRSEYREFRNAFFHSHRDIKPSNLMFSNLALLDALSNSVSTYPSVPARRDVVDGIQKLQSIFRQSSVTDETLWLIPTAEVSLTNLVREQITPEEELPLRLTALTPSFRAEAGSAGRDTRGMIRQHQFYKVELVSITAPEQADEEHERMTTCAEAVLERLGLAWRRMLLCTGDMGFTARKTFDLEVWLPSQGTYREISSCSNCGDFQARRMDARIRKAGEKGTRFAHTLNGSGLAVGRTLVAIMENYQDEGGRIAVPDVLKPYMGGVTHIERA